MTIAGGIFRPGMRAYFIPFCAGVVLTVSAFLPWVIVDNVAVTGIRDIWGMWVAGLGAVAAVLALLSLVTRRNSRHPLLVIGLCALGLMLLSWRIMPRMAGERAYTIAQAFAIVENRPVSAAPAAAAGIGIYFGLAASAVLVLFGLTIVVKRASQPYVVTSPDDDV
jgi:steroid 5-alpha reductase family enzyme